jgi:hypothetical protein
MRAHKHARTRTDAQKRTDAARGRGRAQPRVVAELESQRPTRLCAPLRVSVSLLYHRNVHFAVMHACSIEMDLYL